MKSFTITLVFFYTSLHFLAQVPLPYYTGFNNLAEENGWEQYRVGDAADPIYQWTMGFGTLSHGYPVGGEEITDDWMVSPEFDFANGAVIDSMRFKSSGFGTPFGIDTIAVYHLHAYANPDFAISKTLLKLITDEDFQNDNIWKTFYDLEIEPVTGISYIGFRYKTEVNWFDVSIDDVYISSGIVSVEETFSEREIINVYPNPVVDKLIIQPTESAKIKNIAVTDVRGKVLYDSKSAFFDFDFRDREPGIYILALTTENSKIFKKVLKR